MSDISISVSATRNPILRFGRQLRHDSLLRNSLLIMVTNAFTSALGYLYWVVSARTYAPEAVGLVSAVISAMTLTSLICNIGFTPALFQTLPKRSPGRDWSLTLNTALLVTSLLSVLGSLVVLVLLSLSPAFHSVTTNPVFLTAFVISVPLWTACNLLDATFQAERASSNVLVRNTGFAVLKMIILIGFIPLHIEGLGIFLSWVVGCALSLGIGIVLLRRMKRDYHFTAVGTLGYARTLGGTLIGHHFTSIGGALPYYLLPIFVTGRLSPKDNAYFYTTWMLGTLFGIVSVAVSQSLFAEGAHVGAHLLTNMKRSIGIIVILLAPLMAIFFLFGGTILSVFGKEYPSQGLALLYLLTISTIPDAITSVYISVLRVQNRLREAAFLNILMAAIVLLFSWFLLPTMGIAAVGWGWFISQSTGTLIAIVDFTVTRRARPDLWIAKPILPTPA